MGSGSFPSNPAYTVVTRPSVSGTTISVTGVVRRASGSGYRQGNPKAWELYIGPHVFNGTWTYSFQNGVVEVTVTTRSANVGYGTHRVRLAVTGYFGGAGDSTAYAEDTITIANPTPPPPAAKLPGVPTNLKLRAGTLRVDSFGVEYTRGAENGAVLNGAEAEWSRVSDGVVVWKDGEARGYSNPRSAGNGPGPLLTPGTEYRVRVRERNAAGWGPWTDYFTQRTIGAIRLGRGNQYVLAEVYVGRGGRYVPAQVLIGRNSQFINVN